MRDYATAQTIDQFIDALGEASLGEGRIYLVGGTSAVLKGWRKSTIDIDIKAEPEPKGLFQAIPALKESLQLNVELASPDQFIPQLPNWQDRSPFIRRAGKVNFYHYDFYSQALAKIERGHERDLGDVQQMLDTGLVERDALWDLFLRIEPELLRFPSIDPPTFKQGVAVLTGN